MTTNGKIIIKLFGSLKNNPYLCIVDKEQV